MKRFFILLSILFCTTVFAQTETTAWYVNGKVYATTSCETGGDISAPPQNPTKKGYTFQGWETAVYDMSTLDTSIDGTESIYNNSNGNRTFRIKFSYGYVYGKALCSSTSPSGNDYYIMPPSELNTTHGSGGNCYCSITEFIPTNIAKIYETKTSPWVYRPGLNTSSCMTFCPSYCANQPKTDSSLRAALYGSN